MDIEKILYTFEDDYNPSSMVPGPRIGFADGLSALSFGEQQSIFTPQTLQRILTPAGQKKYGPAYKVIMDALEKAGIKYIPSSGNTGANFNNVTKETIDIFNKEATKLKAKAGLPMSRYQTDKIKKDIKIFVKDKIKKGEYVSRPVIKKHFGLTEGRSGDMLITRSLGINDKAGTGLLKNLGKEEFKEASKINFSKATDEKMKTKNSVLKIINDEFKLDPDLSNSEDLAKTIYGDQFPEGDMKTMSLKDLKKAEALVRQTDNDVMTYLKVIQGVRKKPDGMRLPTQNVINDITDNILTGIDDEVADGKSQYKKKKFRFSSGLLRDYKMAIINKNLGLKPDEYRKERKKLIVKNKNLDEVFSMSGLADVAPGYTTKVQSIKKLINRKKADEIDLPFQRIISALNQGKTSMKVNKKTVPIENVIKDFNKTSSKFSKKNKVQSPKINYNEKFDKTILDSYGKASQKNIKQVYKDKNFFLSEIDPTIKTQDILKKDLLKFAGTITDKCKIDFKAEGGRIGFSTGSADCLRIAKEGLEEGLKNGFKKGNQQVLAEGILKSGRFLKDAVSLRGLFGPAALAFTAAAEAGIVGYDMLASGKSFREAVGDSIFNYALGDKTKIDSDEEFIKRLRNIKVGPQGYQRMGDAEIGKMLQFKSNLEDMYKGFDLSNQLQNVDQAILDNKASQDGTQMFPDTAFQLDAEKDRLQADIQDYNRVGTPRKVTDYFLSDKGTKGADASALADLLVRQDQLKDAGTGGVLPRVDKGVARNLKQTKYGIENLFKGPTGYEEALPSEMSYIMSKIKNEPDNNYGLFGPVQLMEGGIASLNVKK